MHWRHNKFVGDVYYSTRNNRTKRQWSVTCSYKPKTQHTSKNQIDELKLKTQTENRDTT
jgi:hypothetical protein